MRGVVSAGMAAALERLGLTASFDLVVGSSAGAINGGALIAGVARGCVAAYHGPFASRSFVNPARVLWGRPVIDVDYVLAYDSREPRRRAPRARRDEPDRPALRGRRRGDGRRGGPCGHGHQAGAVGRGPGLQPHAVGGGPPVEFGGRRYVDGGLASPIPVAEALAAGATHVLALQTRPYDVPRKSASRLADRLIERHLRGLNPALVTLYRERVATTRRRSPTSPGDRATPAPGPPHVLGLRPPAGTPVRRPARTPWPDPGAAAADAERLVEQALA